MLLYLVMILLTTMTTSMMVKILSFRFSPPTYEAVVNTSALAAASSDDGDGVGDGVAAGEVKLCITPPDCEDEELPPDYASLFRQKKMNGH